VKSAKLSESDTMITEDEAFWAGIAVATMMLGGGFSMLFLQAYTGYGAVVLALGLMTMALTIQMQAKAIEYAEATTPLQSRILTPTPPVEYSREIAEAQISPEPSTVETKTEQTPSEKHEEPPGSVERGEHVESTEPIEPTQPIEQPTTEPQQPPQPQAPTEEKTKPPESEEKPKEDPQVVPATN